MPSWLEDIAGPNFAPAALWTLLALVVLVIVLVIVRIVRSMTFGTFVAGGRNRKTRLAVMDAAAVDSQRRLVLVRRDDVEHLILIGGPTDVVVERDIRLHAPARRPATPANHRPMRRRRGHSRRPPNGQPAPEQRRPARAGCPAGAARAERAPQPAHAAPPPRPKPPAPPRLKPAPAEDAAAIGRTAAQFLDAARGATAAPPPPAPAPAAKPESSDIDLGFANEPAKKKPEMTLEDEMNRLLGELSNKR